MSANLTTSLDDPAGVPYFMWDEPLTVFALRERLRDGSDPERVRLISHILREARDTDVWRFVDLNTVIERWSDLSPRLGRRRAFWEYLIEGWRKDRLIAG